MSLRVLRESKADLLTLVVYDCIGGALCAGAVLLLGITRPPALVSGFHTTPAIAWCVVGALGPLVSVGVLDRIPLREVRASDQRRRPHDENTVARVFAEVRFQASQRILTKLFEEVRVRSGVERDGHRSIARELFKSGRLGFDDVAAEIRAFAGEAEIHTKIPKEVAALLRQREQWPTNQDPGRETLILVDTALEQGLVRPIAVACRVAERRALVSSREMS